MTDYTAEYARIMRAGLVGPRVRAMGVAGHELVKLDSAPVRVCKHCRKPFTWERIEHGGPLPPCEGPQ